VSRWLPASIALLLVLLVVQEAHSTSRAPASCSATGSQTVYDDAEVRVFTRWLNGDIERTVACSHLTGRRVRLAQNSSDESSEAVSHLSARGRWLGYAVEEGFKEGIDTGRACIANLKTGKRRCTHGLPVLGLEATRAGSYAWLAYSGLDPQTDPVCCTVFERDAGASDAVVLDSGPDIEKDSFAVGGHHIYWTKAREPRSAAMP
jgi:hypothetical protein